MEEEEGMLAVILVGGKGTRLSALHPGIPKALVPVAGRPFLQWQLEWLLGAGVRRAHLSCGHMAGQIIDWAAGNPVAGMELSCAEEPFPLGTAGGLLFAARVATGDPFFALNGDSLLPRLRFESMVLALERGAAEAAMAVTSIQAADRYGTVEIGKDGRITAFREKTRCDSGWINAGVYLLKRSVLAAIPENRAAWLETDVFPALAQAGRLMAFRESPPLLDMGTPGGIAAMSEYLAEFGAPRGGRRDRPGKGEE